MAQAKDDTGIAEELISSAAQPEAAQFDPAASGLPRDAGEQLASLPARRSIALQDEVIAHPLAALAAAFVTGYVAARLFR